MNDKMITEEEFWKYIDELCDKAEKNSKLLAESPTPQFNSFEEADKYYNAMPFIEWENKMREKYGF